MNKPHVAVIGGGCAGLSAAATLANQGITVSVLEASHSLGGRARTIDAKSNQFSQVLDNGQHILLGAYTHTLALLAQAGVDIEAAFLRKPLSMYVRDVGGSTTFSIQSIDALPAPFNLFFGFLFCKGISLPERMRAVALMLHLKKTQYQIINDIPLVEFLKAHQQSTALIQFLWEPLCLAALNTPIIKASTRVYLRVLRDSFSGDKHHSDFLLPRQDLSQILANPVAAFIAARGGQIIPKSRVSNIQIDEHSFMLETSNTHSHFSHVVIATAPAHATKLLNASTTLSQLTKQIGQYTYQPIYTVYVQYATDVKLPTVMTGLVNSTAQWVFDRGQLCSQPGLMAVVVSAEGAHQMLSHDALAMRVVDELNRVFPVLGPPLWQQVIAEKRATFTCLPNIAPLRHTTSIKRLYLAGDYTYQDYPATIEGAVRSGNTCAQLIMEDIKSASSIY